MDALPVSPSLKVLAYNSYVRTSRRWVALCVVSDGSRTSLRFYKWRLDEASSQWKVDLARFSVEDINLRQISQDALEFAKAYKIRLDWVA